MELGLIRKVDIDSEMQQSYLDYAMSVIVARALPDARDGLKPVQRRVLYAMYDMGIRSDSTYKKSARIVGEVLGKYHPHGDVAVYESMARLAQDFTMRYGLVDGQGNFGSVDGDPPAAMRYTEARLTSFAMEMLGQIERDTVNFNPNFDNTLTEPLVLPAAVPNLLVNGASGIAVGMATNIPPHNLGEIVDALILLLREWDRMDDLSISDLMRFVQGPDFPTGGIILEENGQNELLQAYATGRGRVIVRGRVQKEDMERGKSRLIISELPYQVNKSALIERIADLVRDGVLEGIADLRDESDRQGMRIVIELKAGTEAEQVLRQLYQRTPLESTFGIMLLALVDGEPRLLSLKQALRVYIEHRLVVIKRRSEYDLSRARARAHILEGLRVALANLDEIISLIKAAPDVEQARERLIKRFKLSELQAQAILDMQLRRLAALERKKIELEYKELQTVIHELETLLKSPKKMRLTVEEELLAIKEKYNDKRRTRIVSLKAGESAKELLTTNEMTPAQTVWIGIMEDGVIGRAHEDALPRLSGRAAPCWLLRANTHHTLYLTLEDGRAAAVAVESIPDVEKFSDGVPLNKVSPLEPGEPLAAAVTLPPRTNISGEAFVLTVSRLGMVKKTLVEELPGPSTQRFVLAKVNPGDTIGWTFVTDGSAEIIIVTAQGMAIRFSEQDVRPMGLVAAGVNGIKLAGADQVIGAARLSSGQEILALAVNGKAWRYEAGEFPVQGRYGQGVQLCKLESGNKLVGILVGKRMQAGLIHFRQAAARSMRLDEIIIGKRQRSGQDLAPVKPGDGVVDITPVIDGLGLWSKPEPASKKRGQKSEPAVQSPPPLEIFDEKEVQAALPGLDTPTVPPAKDHHGPVKPNVAAKGGAAKGKTVPESAKARRPEARPKPKVNLAAEPLPLPPAEKEPPAPAEKTTAQRGKKAAVIEPKPVPAAPVASNDKGPARRKTPAAKPAPAGKTKQTEVKTATQWNKPTLAKTTGDNKNNATIGKTATVRQGKPPAQTAAAATKPKPAEIKPSTANKLKISLNDVPVSLPRLTASKKAGRSENTIGVEKTAPTPVESGAKKTPARKKTNPSSPATARSAGTEEKDTARKTPPAPVKPDTESHGWEQVDHPASTGLRPGGKEKKPSRK